MRKKMSKGGGCGVVADLETATNYGQTEMRENGGRLWEGAVAVRRKWREQRMATAAVCAASFNGDHSVRSVDLERDDEEDEQGRQLWCCCRSKDGDERRANGDAREWRPTIGRCSDCRENTVTIGEGKGWQRRLSVLRRLTVTTELDLWIWKETRKRMSKDDSRGAVADLEVASNDGQTET